MADYVLQVPLVGQKVGYDNKPLMQMNAHGQNALLAKDRTRS